MPTSRPIDQCSVEDLLILALHAARIAGADVILLERRYVDICRLRDQQHDALMERKRLKEEQKARNALGTVRAMALRLRNGQPGFVGVVKIKGGLGWDTRWICPHRHNTADGPHLDRPSALACAEESRWRGELGRPKRIPKICPRCRISNRDTLVNTHVRDGLGNSGLRCDACGNTLWYDQLVYATQDQGGAHAP